MSVITSVDASCFISYDFRSYIYPIVHQRCYEIRMGKTTQSLSQDMGNSVFGDTLMDVEKVANNVCGVLISEIMKYPDFRDTNVVQEKKYIIMRINLSDFMENVTPLKNFPIHLGLRTFQRLRQP